MSLFGGRASMLEIQNRALIKIAGERTQRISELERELQQMSREPERMKAEMERLKAEHEFYYTAQANRGKPARHCEAHSPAGERHGGRASRGRGRHGNEGPGGATAGDDRKMNNEPLEREPIDRVRARLEALLKANAAPRCGARSKRTGKPCRGAAMPNGRCKLHGGKSTGPRTPEGLERSRRANWKHGHFSREAKAERSRVRAAILAVRYLRDSI